MSKYYCEYCTTEFHFYNNGSYKYKDASCPACHTYPFRKIPDYETPEQYEKRTGKKWPDNAPVYFRDGCIGWRVSEYAKWKEIIRKLAKEAGHNDFTLKATVYPCVCAQSPESPPDDWKPEEGV